MVDNRRIVILILLLINTEVIIEDRSSSKLYFMNSVLTSKKTTFLHYRLHKIKHMLDVNMESCLEIKSKKIKYLNLLIFHHENTEKNWVLRRTVVDTVTNFRVTQKTENLLKPLDCQRLKNISTQQSYTTFSYLRDRICSRIFASLSF